MLNRQTFVAAGSSYSSAPPAGENLDIPAALQPERDRDLALLLDARQRICDLVVLLRGYDTALAADLYPVNAKIDLCLGRILLERQLAERGRS